MGRYGAVYGRPDTVRGSQPVWWGDTGQTTDASIRIGAVWWGDTGQTIWTPRYGQGQGACLVGRYGADYGRPDTARGSQPVRWGDTGQFMDAPIRPGAASLSGGAIRGRLWTPVQ